MLKIKSEQIRVFQTDAEQAFVGRVMDYLREKHGGSVVRLPDRTSRVGELTDEILKVLVRGGIKRAGDHGIEWKSTLLSFVVLLFIGAPNFDEYPPAASFFRQTETVDDAALENLMDALTDEDWRAIENRYDQQAWNLPIQEGENL